MDEKLVFLHIPKTGGTTLHNLLITNFTEDEICEERFNKLDKLDPTELERKKFFSGHFKYEDVMRYIPEPKKIITILREPKSRILSYYYFARSHKMEFILKYFPVYLPAKQLNLIEYLENQKNKLSNKMVRILSNPAMSEDEQLELAKQRLGEMTAFAITEELGLSIEYIFSILNLPVPQETPREMAFERLADEFEHCEKIVKEPLTEEIKEKLDELTVLDRELYQYALKLWTSKILV